MRCPSCLEMFDGTWSETLEDVEPTQQMLPEQATGLVFVRTPFGPKLVDSTVSNEVTVSVPFSQDVSESGEVMRRRSSAPSQRPTAPPAPSDDDRWTELEVPIPSDPREREDRIEDAIASALFLRSVDPVSSKPLSLANVERPEAPAESVDPITSLEVETRVLGRVDGAAQTILLRRRPPPAKQVGKLALACLLAAVLVVLGGLAIRRASMLLGDHASTGAKAHATSG